MNVSEQLTAEKTALQTKSARLEELMTADQTNGGLEADEQRELETLTGEFLDALRLTAAAIDRDLAHGSITL